MIDSPYYLLIDYLINWLIDWLIDQEFGDSARARKLYAADSDDDEEEELEPNPKLAAGRCWVQTLSCQQVYG